MSEESLCIKRLETRDEIYKVLCDFDAVFEQPLSTSCNLFEYADKLYHRAYVYVAVEEDVVLGFTAFYANDVTTRAAFGTLIALVPEAQGRNIAAKLHEVALEVARENKMTEFRVEVHKDNKKSLRHCEKMGFKYFGEGSPDNVILSKKI